MKALITGGAGFIGSHAVDLLLENGFQVVVVDDLSTGRAANLDPRARFHRLDVRSPELARLFETEQPDFVCHYAAQVDVRRSVADPLFDAQVNVIGSLNLLECARRAGIRRFVYISTGGAVYGEPQYLPCDEDHPVNPLSQYGASKHIVEHYLYLYHANYGLDYTVLRFPNVYGPRQDPNGEAGVVAIFTRQMLRGEPVTINGDGEQTRDFVYVTDCARANLLALTIPHENGIYNLGSERGTSINELFSVLAGITQYPLPPRHGPPKLGETRYIYLRAAKIAKTLGWQPTTSLEDGLRQTVEHFKAFELAS